MCQLPYQTFLWTVSIDVRNQAIHFTGKLYAVCIKNDDFWLSWHSFTSCSDLLSTVRWISFHFKLTINEENFQMCLNWIDQLMFEDVISVSGGQWICSINQTWQRLPVSLHYFYCWWIFGRYQHQSNDETIKRKRKKKQCEKQE